MLNRWTVCVALMVAVCGFGTPAAAQTNPDKWEVLVAPYLMGAAMSGTATVRGLEADLNMSASDILSNLDFGFMAVAGARKGRWGFGTDIIWMDLGATRNNVTADFSQGAFAFYSLRELSPAADVTFGIRINTLSSTVTFEGPGIEVAQDKAWVDPIVGLTLRTPWKHRMQVRVYSEVGGFGLGSDFTWQIFPMLGIRMVEKASFELGYRWLDVDYATGDGNEAFAWNMLTQGPAFGFAFRF
jgi:hypothetical protein